MLLIFDFDGTICDGTAHVIDLVNQALAINKVSPPVTIRELRSRGLKGILSSRNLTVEDLGKSNVHIRRSLASRIPEMTSFPRLPETLTALAAHHQLGIITSNLSENVQKFLELNHMADVFDFVESEDDVFGKHTKITAKKADFYIGDETRDIDAARRAGVKIISVTWGFESKDLLSKSNPDYIIDSPSQLLDITK